MPLGTPDYGQFWQRLRSESPIAPLGEKIEAEENLFAIRVMTGGNYRFFYCYDTGTIIYVLNGYQKKSRLIPKRELKRAKQIRKELGL